MVGDLPARRRVRCLLLPLRWPDALPNYSGDVVGMLGMVIPHLTAAHIVAVDEAGVIDPADNAPNHIPLQQYVLNRLDDGVVFHDVWLAVRRPIRVHRAGENILKS